MSDGVPSEYGFCQRFRRWAKRAAALPRGRGDPDEDEGRTELIEAVWEFVGELYVWGAPEILAQVLTHLYAREDKEAACLLTELADTELRALQESSDGGEEPGSLDLTSERGRD